MYKQTMNTQNEENVSIIKKANAQFHIFLIPNQIGPKIHAYKLNEKENEGLLPIF